MKQAFTVLFLMMAMSISGQSNVESVTTFLDGIIQVEGEKINEHNPILTINSLASAQADETMKITEENIGEVLEKGEQYAHCLISVNQHTLVLITNWEDCTQSGAWNTCMPYGEGFIKRENLEKHEDYINNIIGIPDGQRRMAFFFE